MKNNNKDIPIIKLFIVNEKCYFYDACTNQVLSISHDLYRELNILLEIGVSRYLLDRKESCGYNDVKKLINGEYINTKKINSIEHKYIHSVEVLVSRYVSQLQLQVTRNCNFDCRYCIYTRKSNIGRNHECVNMPFTLAQKSVDYLFNHSQDASEITIYFYGGEPFLNFELIKSTVEYAEKKFIHKELRFIAITNGSIINDDIISFLVMHNITLIISFDGESKIQNLHRRFMIDKGDTYDHVYNNIVRIQNFNQNYFYTNVKFNAVILPDENKENVLSFFSQTFNKDPDFINLIPADTRGVDYIYSKINYNNIQKEDNTKILSDYDIEKYNRVYQDKRRLTPKWVHNTNCVPGVQRLFVNVYGELYPCEKVSEISDCSIGNIFTEIDINKVKQIMNISDMTKKDCENCWAIRFCTMCICHCVDEVNCAIRPSTKLENCKIEKKKALCFLKEFARQQ